MLAWTAVVIFQNCGRTSDFRSRTSTSTAPQQAAQPVSSDGGGAGYDGKIYASLGACSGEITAQTVARTTKAGGLEIVREACRDLAKPVPVPMEKVKRLMNDTALGATFVYDAKIFDQVSADQRYTREIAWAPGLQVLVTYLARSPDLLVATVETKQKTSRPLPLGAVRVEGAKRIYEIATYPQRDSFRLAVLPTNESEFSFALQDLGTRSEMRAETYSQPVPGETAAVGGVLMPPLPRVRAGVCVRVTCTSDIGLVKTIEKTTDENGIVYDVSPTGGSTWVFRVDEQRALLDQNNCWDNVNVEVAALVPDRVGVPACVAYAKQGKPGFTAAQFSKGYSRNLTGCSTVACN